jgi:hypothetical protein
MTFRFRVVTADLEPLGEMEFSVPNWHVGDTIPRGPGETLRVVGVYSAELEGELPTLVVAPVAA